MLVCSGCDAYCDGNIPSLAPAGGLYGIAFSCLHLLCDLLFCEPLADVILYVTHGRKHTGGTMYFYIQILLIKSLSLQLTGKIPKKTLTKCIFARQWHYCSTMSAVQISAAYFYISASAWLQRNVSSHPEAVALTTVPAVQLKTYLTNLFGSHISYLITWSTHPEELLWSSCQSLMNWTIT